MILRVKAKGQGKRCRGKEFQGKNQQVQEPRINQKRRKKQQQKCVSRPGTNGQEGFGGRAIREKILERE